MTLQKWSIVILVCAFSPVKKYNTYVQRQEEKQQEIKFLSTVNIHFTTTGHLESHNQHCQTI
jgi:hypothetical protein